MTLIGRLTAARLGLAAVAAGLAALWAAGLIGAPAAILVFLMLAAVLAAGLGTRPEPAPEPGSGGTGGDDLAPPLRRFAEALPDPAFLLDGQAAVRFANHRGIGTFGIRAGDFLTVRLRHPDLVAAFERVAAGEGAQRVQFAERVPTERWFSAWFAPLGDEAPPGLVLLILDDLSAARATERMRVDFVANASHELRTPLASLAGFIETLQGPARNDAAARERFLAVMHEQAARMGRLVDDLLSLSRIEMKAHLRPRDPVELGGLVRHVADALAPLAKESGVVIETELPAAPLFVPGDRDELVQVFDNLIENACKYGQSGGRAVVRVEPAGAGAAVRVTDFGPGIAAEHLPRLTERFYRIDAEESRRHSGTGLGLAIVKHIVSRHRARLTIESEPGKGARFSVLFPETMPAPADKAQPRQ